MIEPIEVTRKYDDSWAMEDITPDGREIALKLNELIAAYNEHYHPTFSHKNQDQGAFTGKPIEATELGGDDHE